MSEPQETYNETLGIITSCVAMLGSASVTCLMLFLNGSLVLAILRAPAGAGPEWFQDPKFNQFVLFSMPVVLTVTEWKMIDYVRTRVTKSSVGSDEAGHMPH